jgi:superfamily II DNA/RNA helicase
MNLCDIWKSNKNINPVTTRKISSTGDIYKNIDNFCNNRDENCGKLKNSPLINPLTSKKLKYNSNILSLFNLLCESKEKEKEKSKEIIEEAFIEALVSANKESKKEAKKAVVEDVIDYYDEISPLQCTHYPTIALKDHQKNLCKFILDNPEQKGMLLFHSVGSGKTITSLTIIRCLLSIHKGKNVFIITPKSIVENFNKEITKLGIKFPKNVEITTHTKFTNMIKNKGPKFAKDSIIVVDEAHNFKGELVNKKEKLTKKVIGMKSGYKAKLLMSATKIAFKVFLLSATPVQNRADEFTNLYAMISNEENNLKKIRKVFAESDYKTMDKMLKNKISYFKNSDTTEYPSVEYHNVSFYMSKEYYKLYRIIEQNELDKLKITNIFASSTDLQKFLNGVRRATNITDSDIPTPKVEWIIKFIEKNEKRENPHKILIYSNWIKSGIKLIQDILNKKSISWVEVYGDMTSKARTQAVNSYNGTLEGKYQDNKVNILFISSAGSEGLDLKNTRDVIILEPHWNNEKLNQVIGRAVRYQSHIFLPKSQQKVDIYKLVLKKPIKKTKYDTTDSADDILYEMSEEKTKQINKFYDIVIRNSIEN